MTTRTSNARVELPDSHKEAPGGDNGVNRVKGYAARTGWDPCTGLGSPNGVKLLAALA